MVVPLAIMLGWLAARHRVLDEPWNHVPMLRRLAIGGIALGWLTGLPGALTIAGLLPRPEAGYWMFAGMNYLGGLICGLGFAAAFALLAMRLEGRTAHPGPAPVTGPAEPESSAVTGPAAPESSAITGRSEEHTSELQSRGQLVCRLLLEKKNRTHYIRSDMWPSNCPKRS